jgi:molybdenum cofactor biosynthesis enzyme MoaA
MRTCATEGCVRALRGDNRSGHCWQCYHKSSAHLANVRKYQNAQPLTVTQKHRKLERQAERRQGTRAEDNAKAREYSATARRDPERSARRKATKRAWYTGVNPELFSALLTLQNSACATCTRLLRLSGRGSDSVCADHYETLEGVRVPQQTKGATKHPRGLLCRVCNTSLGMYEAHQRPHGLRLAEYEQYLACPPVSRLQLARAAE